MNLQIQLKNYRCFSDEHPARFELRKGTHALIGQNNSGKSSLLKVFYDFRNLFSLLNNLNFVVHSISNERDFQFDYQEGTGDPHGLFFDGNSRDLEILVDMEYTSAESEQFFTEIAPTRISFKIPRGQNRSLINIDVNGQRLPKSIVLRDNRFVCKDNDHAKDILDGRSLIEISEMLTKTLYVGPFRNAISAGAGLDRTDKYFDIQAGPAFIQAWKYFKSGHTKKSSELCFQLESQIKSIFGYEALQVNPFAHDQDLQIMANGRSYKSSDVGAGILQFVIVLANAAMASPRVILIDEPELNLHPTLQLDFLTTLGSYATDAVIFATHSVGLARASAERL